MPVTTRRYGTSSIGSSSYLSSSSLGNYRSSYSLSSSTATASPSSRYNFGDSSNSSTSYRSYRSGHSTSGSSALGGNGTYSTSSYRNSLNNNNNVSSNSYDENKNSLSTRIGVSNTENSDCSSLYRSRYNRISIDKDLTTSKSTLSSLPPQSPYSSTTSSTLLSPYLSKKRPSRDSDSGVGASSKSDLSSSNGYSSSNYYSARSTSSLPKNSSINLANDIDDLFEKYSPSRYRTKYELSSSSARSLSDASASNTKSNIDDVDLNSDTSINKSSTYTPKSEVNYLFLIPFFTLERTFFIIFFLNIFRLVFLAFLFYNFLRERFMGVCEFDEGFSSNFCWKSPKAFWKELLEAF